MSEPEHNILRLPSCLQPATNESPWSLLTGEQRREMDSHFSSLKCSQPFNLFPSESEPAWPQSHFHGGPGSGSTQWSFLHSHQNIAAPIEHIGLLSQVSHFDMDLDPLLSSSADITASVSVPIVSGLSHVTEVSKTNISAGLKLESPNLPLASKIHAKMSLSAKLGDSAGVELGFESTLLDSGTTGSLGFGWNRSSLDAKCSTYQRLPSQFCPDWPLDQSFAELELRTTASKNCSSLLGVSVCEKVDFVALPNQNCGFEIEKSISVDNETLAVVGCAASIYTRAAPAAVEILRRGILEY